ncbi:hypothetical protein ALC57_03726 [Trachymyrmex cornetzi]|uniref:Uncharacterized protein n=1 Tax=Trachymyrmex cornetzi TaxID=471704 RepID=A0A151JMP1_9HYME|nr:hypothetical protein ALC57_03726 [Trachymyrmex cornetzi]
MRIVSNGCSWLPFRDQPCYSSFRQNNSVIPFYRLSHDITHLAVHLCKYKNIKLLSNLK